jgi:metallo-beta-lactamase family protein
MAAMPPVITALTPDHPLPDGELQLLGAFRSVTGAMTRVTAGGARVLVDCGVAQGEEAIGWQVPDPARDVDAVVLTHGHNDHVGSLPALIDRGYDGPIYATHATLDIAGLVLADGLRLQGGTDQEADRFVRRLRQLARPLPYGAPFDPGGTGLQARLHEAGHILGSSSVELRSAASRVIVSGDLGRPDTPILPDYNTRWDPGPPVDVAVLETTYGDRDHSCGHGDVEAELERIVRRAVADGGHILVPAFAIGRTQLLLYHLNSLIEAGRLPDLPVALDSPLGLKVTDLYQDARHLFDREAAARLATGDDPLDFRTLYAVKRGADSIRLRDVRQPMLIIAGSGMCTGGRIIGHLQELLPRPETCVLFVGYQAAGTPGRAIQAARPGDRVRIDGEDVPVRASIETLPGLSAHADRSELLRWVRALPETRRLALHHGEPSQQTGFRDWASGELATATRSAGTAG